MLAGFTLAPAVVLGLMCLVGWAVANHLRLRHVVLKTVDPRPLAVFRMLFGACLLLNLLEVWPLADYLFSSAGLIPHAAVAELRDPAALAGYDGVHARFYDAQALLHYLAHGRWSLLHFADTPAFVRGYLTVLVAVVVGLIVGVRPRFCAVAAWFLYAGLLRRGNAHWGGEQVFCGFLLPLAVSRCGEAFSLENVWRCRRLRKLGLLSTRESPGAGTGSPPTAAHPQGLAAIYRRIPVWPQVVIAGQLGLLYFANGWAKSGPAWVAGDALALTLDHDPYTRFELHNLLVQLGPWPGRLATWTVMWWERLFPVVLVGMWLRASRSAPALTPRASHVARACLLGLAVALVMAALTPGLAEKPDPTVMQPRVLALVVTAFVVAGLAVWPNAVTRGLARVAVPGLWLGVGLAFHLANFVLLNVGAFALATLAAYVVCGGETAAVHGLHRVTRWLAQRGLPLPAHWQGESPISAEDRNLPHLQRNAVALPTWALAVACGLVLASATAGVWTGSGRPQWWWQGAWWLALAGLMIGGWRAARATNIAHTNFAYGPAGRLAAASVMTYHLVALLLWQTPGWQAVTWRTHAREAVQPWMGATFTSQLWSMFAPNPPGENRSLRTVVRDAAGTLHDLRSELQHPENLVRPSIWPDRMRKVHEAIVGPRGKLGRWHARYLCRQWAQDHAGELPREVALFRVRAPKPPSESLDPVAWFWRHAQVTALDRVVCATEPFAQLVSPPTVDVEATTASTWPPTDPRHDPLLLLWPGAAGVLVVGFVLWARDDRRRRRRRRQDLRASE